MKVKIKNMLKTISNCFKNLMYKLKCFFNKIKPFWLLYLFSSVLFIGSTILLFVGNNCTYTGKVENLSYQVSRYAKTNEFKSAIMNIEQQNINGVKLVNEHRTYKYINGQTSPQYDLNYCYIGINSKISNDFSTKYADNEFATKSILFPNVFSSSEKIVKHNGIEEKCYKMDDMDLYLKFKKPSLAGYGVNWCVISSNSAQNIADELNLDSIEKVIGKTIDVKYSVLNQEYNNTWTVVGIYDSELGSAKKLTSQFGDFILSWLIYTNTGNHMHYNLDGLSLSFELHYSIKNNTNVIKRELSNLSPKENKYTFLTSNNYEENTFLYNSLLDTYSKKNYTYWNTYNICSLILYASLLSVIIITFFINSKKSNVDISVFAFLLICLLVCFGIIQIITLSLQSANYASSFIVYHGSQSTIIIYGLIITYLFVIKLISHKFKKKEKVTNND